MMPDRKSWQFWLLFAVILIESILLPMMANEFWSTVKESFSSRCSNYQSAAAALCKVAFHVNEAAFISRVKAVKLHKQLSQNLKAIPCSLPINGYQHDDYTGRRV